MKRTIEDLLHAAGFNNDYFREQAFLTKFKQRERVLKAIDYVIMILINVPKQMMSYNAMAASLVTTEDRSVTRQALQPVMKTKEFVAFMEKIFSDILNMRLAGQTPEKKTL